MARQIITDEGGGQLAVDVPDVLEGQETLPGLDAEPEQSAEPAVEVRAIFRGTHHGQEVEESQTLTPPGPPEGWDTLDRLDIEFHTPSGVSHLGSVWLGAERNDGGDGDGA